MRMRVLQLLPMSSMPLTVQLWPLVASALLLLLCSTSCLGSHYHECLSTDNNRCGSFNFIYPFGKSNSGCGDPEFQLDCLLDDDGGHPVMNISGEKYHILEPDFLGLTEDINDNVMTIINDNLLRGKCNFSGNYSQFWRPGPHFGIAQGYTNLTLLGLCNKSKEEMSELGFSHLCGHDWYYTNRTPEEWIPFCQTHLQLPIKKKHLYEFNNPTLPLWSGFEITWYVDPDRYNSCDACLMSNGTCGYSSSVQFLCYCPDGSTYPDRCPAPHGRKSKHGIVIGCSFGGVALIATAIAFFLTFYRKRRTQPPPPRSSISKVETFLKEYAYQMPTRYSQSELKKITNNFAEKLGEGGFGVVYKGKLSNGALVAVKLLDRHRHSESQFMNEVATIGRVHHVNLVRLLGYCFQSFTSALVYEYMVNGSLEKFIFAGKEMGQVLRWEQLHSIALGVARGVAYLHQDCDKRIIHFDIKPHNILLGPDFTPKVADFGLAKLCGKGEDHISMTGGRGTPGYVAPEVCDGDVGPVTDKSDVYSFGMLLLEIVGRRKNFDWKASRSSQFYFPEWAFKLLETGEFGMRLRGEGEMEAEEEEKAKKLTKVGLWCIQYNPRDRPCMSRVVQMLEGNGDDVSNPPLPFNSSAAPEDPRLSSTERSCSMWIVD